LHSPKQYNTTIKRRHREKWKDQPYRKQQVIESIKRDLIWLRKNGE